MGKTIVVTGAGDGLGRALARRLAADGDTVALLGRTEAKVRAVADELGGPHRAFACDVGDPDSVSAAFAAVGEAFGRIDVLVNNAAIYEPFTLADTTDQQVLSSLSTNVAGPVFCARAALPLFGGSGHIVNVTSESVSLKLPMLWMYAGGKAAVELMSEMWDRELGEDGIRVTVIRAGKMYDEAKAPPPWPRGVAVRFMAESARSGNDLRTAPLSHYRSVTDAFRAVIDTPPDIHIGLVTLGGARPRTPPGENS